MIECKFINFVLGFFIGMGIAGTIWFIHKCYHGSLEKHLAQTEDKGRLRRAEPIIDKKAVKNG